MTAPRHTADSITSDALDALYERLAVAEQLAGALTDYSSEGWHLAETIRRLCAGEITPQQALDNTDD